MNTELFSLIAKFTIHARKIVGAIDTSRFIADADYRNSIYSVIDEKGDEELLGLSFTVKDKMGMLGQSQPNPAEPITPSEPSNKYKFGARG